MRKLVSQKFLWLSIVMFIACLFTVSSVEAKTQVGGEIKADTTWTREGSPYVLVKTIEIPKNKTLTIEPGVTVQMPEAFTMFKLKGRLVACGTEEEKIIFDGGGNSDFFDAQNSGNTAFLDLDYAVIRDGGRFWRGGFGYFSLRHSELKNLSAHSTLYYPAEEVYIEYNQFKNTAGFSIQTGHNVYFRYNLFSGRHPAVPSYEDYLIKSVSTFNDSGVIIENNAFIDLDGIVLRLGTESPTARIEAGGNFWGTTSPEVVAEMIYDHADNSNIANYINYEPILSAANPDTAGVSAPVPLVLGELATTTEEAQIIISGCKEAGTAVWLDEKEIISASTSTSWSYTADLAVGENVFSFRSKNSYGLFSQPAVATITRMVICQSWDYSGWGQCISGRQRRKIVAAYPSGCSGGEPILERSCAAGKEDVVAREKSLVGSIDESLAERLAGRILLQVESAGEAWYVNPRDKKRYYLGRPADAFRLMQELGLGARHKFISAYSVFPDFVRGRILLDVDDAGKAYYINPVDGRAYYLGRPADAFRVMRELGLGITNGNIRKIAVGEL